MTVANDERLIPVDGLGGIESLSSVSDRGVRKKQQRRRRSKSKDAGAIEEGLTSEADEEKAPNGHIDFQA